ncbi:MAG TPA: hypothetical protein VFW33_13185 [Gemmataceae bacterium]|nr:hypothetical protein [Gemmataceae bacterium]
MQAFYAAMTTNLEGENRQAVAVPAGGPTVAEVFEKYPAWCQKHREARTYDWYRGHIQGFIDFRPEVAALTVPELRPFHVTEWADSHGEGWSPAYRRGTNGDASRKVFAKKDLRHHFPLAAGAPCLGRSGE